MIRENGLIKNILNEVFLNKRCLSTNQLLCLKEINENDIGLFF